MVFAAQSRVMTPLPYAPASIRLLKHAEERLARTRESEPMETFILFDDDAGKKLHAAPPAASPRGVHMAVTVDGYGAHGLPPASAEGK